MRAIVVCGGWIVLIVLFTWALCSVDLSVCDVVLLCLNWWYCCVLFVLVFCGCLGCSIVPFVACV